MCADEIGDERRRRRAVDLGSACRPARSTPWFITTMRSAMASASSWSCVTMMVVTPRRFCRARISSRRRTRTLASSAESGSSRRRRSGRRRERAGERDALLLAARELRRVFAMLLGQADEREKLVDPTLDLGRALAAVDEAVADVLGDGEVREQGVGLEHDAEIALRRRRARHVAAGDLDPALVLRVEAGDGAQERGLAAAGRPEEAHELAAPDLEIDRLQGREGAEALRQALDAQKRLLGHRRGITTVMSFRAPRSGEPGTHGSRSAVGSGSRLRRAPE